MVVVALVLTGPPASEIPNVRQVMNEDLLKHMVLWVQISANHTYWIQDSYGLHITNCGKVLSKLLAYDQDGLRLSLIVIYRFSTYVISNTTDTDSSIY